MSRLTKSEVEKRENFMKSLFEQTPDLSMPQANLRCAQVFGSQMRPQRVYAIRREVQEALSGAKTKEEQVVKQTDDAKKSNGKAEKALLTGAARNPNAPGKPRAEILEVPAGQEKVAADILETLKKKGLMSGSVEHSGNGYVVVVTPA